MGHGHGHAAGRAADRSRLRWALLVTLVVLVVEVVGAVLTGSLALLADAGHMATDAGAVVLALGASYVASRPASRRSTFGYHRAEVLAALLNALVLLGVCAYLAYAGISRLGDPVAIEAGPMIAFATVGLVANGTSLMILNRSDTGSLNMRAAVAEVGADLLGSLFAIAAGIAILGWGFDRADALASLAIAALIVPRAGLLLRTPRRSCSRSHRRTSTSTASSTTCVTSTGCSTSTTCTRGRSRAASPASRPTSPSPTRPWPSAASE